jgi:hypothetical protein
VGEAEPRDGEQGEEAFPDDEYSFGLDRILDGLAALDRTRRPRPRQPAPSDGTGRRVTPPGPSDGTSAVTRGAAPSPAARRRHPRRGAVTRGAATSVVRGGG